MLIKRRVIIHPTMLSSKRLKLKFATHCPGDTATALINPTYVCLALFWSQPSAETDLNLAFGKKGYKSIL